MRESTQMSFLAEPREEEPVGLRHAGARDALPEADPFSRGSGARLTGKAWGPDITRRMRTLLHALPLFRLHHSNEIIEGRGGEYAHYDSFALAFRVCDLIIESTGLGDEPETDEMGRMLGPTLSAMDRAAGIEPDPERHARMAERVMNKLLNASGHGEPFEVEYSDFDGDVAQQRKLEVRLVREQYMPGDRLVPRLTAEMTNLYLSALDLSIEDQQIAMAAVLKKQVERGVFGDAYRTARSAFALSVQYRERVETFIRETRRDAIAVDWSEEVPMVLQRAREHIEERIETDRTLRQGAEEKLGPLELGSEDARSLAAVIQLVDRCAEQHGALLRQLILALPAFLDEQARQAFVPRYARRAPDLGSEVLEPLLRLPKRVALEGAEYLLTQFVPPDPPQVFDLTAQVEWHFRPRTEPRSTSRPVEEIILSDAPLENLVFSGAEWNHATEVLDGVREPERLSAILGRMKANGDGENVRQLVALIAFYAYAPEEESVWAGPRAEKTGIILREGVYQGDDLLLFREPDSDNDLRVED
jgi:hypothetical protein